MNPEKNINHHSLVFIFFNT